MTFIKWVGGKTQILDELFKRFPKTMNNYIEPFLGGGSVLIELLNKLEKKEITLTGQIYCSDINQNLINCYNHIKTTFNELIKELDELVKLNNQNKNLANSTTVPNTLQDAIKQGNDSLYYYLRKEYNNDNTLPIRKSALLIFLNKTCFRGLYRAGKNGFNVPYGNYKNPTIYDYDHLTNLNKLFNKYNVTFACEKFTDAVYKRIQVNDFCYLDPPYYPIDSTSFVDYNKDGFNENDHNDLILLCMNLDLLGNKFLLSNSDTDYIKNNLQQFQTDIIKCKRAINSKNPNSMINEVLVRNF